MLFKHWEGTLSCCGHCGMTTSLCIWPQICHSHRPLTISESVPKCLNDTLPPLQCLLLHLSQYQMDVQYVIQKYVSIADCMSRLIDLKAGIDDPSLSLQIADITMDPNSIDWNQIKRRYLNNPTMVRLA